MWGGGGGGAYVCVYVCVDAHIHVIAQYTLSNNIIIMTL